MSRTLKITIAAFAILAISAPAALAQPGEAVSLRVPYGDLDMSSPAGGQTLLKRIEGAARHACRDTTEPPPQMQRSESKCRHMAIENAVRDAGIDTLTLAWSGKYPATRMASR